MKKLLTLATTTLMGVIAFAEETAGSSDALVSTEDVEGIFGNAQTALGDLLTSALPVVGSLVVGGLVIWGAIALIGILKKAFSAGKGR